MCFRSSLMGCSRFENILTSGYGKMGLSGKRFGGIMAETAPESNVPVLPAPLAPPTDKGEE